MTPRSMEEIRERATELNRCNSLLVQRQTELETKIDAWWERPYDVPDEDSGLETLEELLEETDSDLAWNRATLEALEWVLGETDVRPEIPMEAENDQINSANQEESSDDKRPEGDIPI